MELASLYTVPLSTVNGLSRLTKLMTSKGAGTADPIQKSNRPIFESANPFRIESNRTAYSNSNRIWKLHRSLIQTLQCWLLRCVSSNLTSISVTCETLVSISLYLVSSDGNMSLMKLTVRLADLCEAEKLSMPPAGTNSWWPSNCCESSLESISHVTCTAPTDPPVRTTFTYSPAESHIT